MRKTALILLVFAGVLSLSVVAISQSPKMGQRPRDFTRSEQGRLLGILDARKEELKITDKQLAKIKDLQMMLGEKRVEHQNNANTQRLELKKWQTNTDKRDYDTLRTLLNKRAQARTDMLISQIQMREQVFNVLTEEQREALKANNHQMGRERGPSRDQRRRQQGRFPRSRRFLHKR